MNRPFATATLVFALLALPAVGDAQTPRNNSADAPIAWSGDSFEAVRGTLTLRGRAELIQGQNRLRADQISGLNQNSDSQIEASGNVFFVTPEQTIRGDRAVYTTADGIIVVTGDVILTQGRNVATGSRLTYNVRTDSARFDSGSNGRVQGVFYPNQTGN